MNLNTVTFDFCAEMQSSSVCPICALERTGLANSASETLDLMHFAGKGPVDFSGQDF